MEDELLIDLEYKIAAIHFRNFNTRIQKACNKAGIVTVGDLVSMSEGCFAAHGPIGQGTKTTINDFLAKHGLRFGMSDKEIHAYRVRYIEQDQEQKRLSLPPGASVWEEKILGLSQQIFKDLYIKSGSNQRTDILAKLAICAAQVFFEEYRKSSYKDMNVLLDR